jgi:hypothetical protein
MFKRQWLRFGKLVSDEGCEISYAHKSVYYRDNRDKFEFPYEDGILMPTPFQVAGEAKLLNQPEIDQMVERVVSGIKADGHPVQIYSK